MKYVYSAVLSSNEDGQISITIPDLAGCYSYGENEADALFMGQDALEMWLWNAENTNLDIPEPSKELPLKAGERLTLIAADTNEYRRKHDAKSVKKTLSIPSWLNYQAEQANAPFSQILQEGLKQYLGVQETA